MIAVGSNWKGIECMGTANLHILLVLSEARTAELEKRNKDFENLTKVLSMEVDRQRIEIESMRRKGKTLKINHLRKVA